MNLSFDLGTSAESQSDKIWDVIVIGSGPSGLSAALYASRAHLDTLVLTGEAIGGQVSLTSDVDNYPGFPDGIGGVGLVQNMQSHAERFGATIQIETVAAVDLSQRPFLVSGQSGNTYARALIVATGASPRMLDVPGEHELTGRGVSYCATCDGWFFQGKHVVVVGGGDSALEEALFLTKYARKVTVVHRRNELRAGPALQKRAFANEKIEFIWNAIVTEISGTQNVEAVELTDTQTGKQWEQPIDGVFIFIGHVPNGKLFEGQLEIDDRGYIVVNRHMATNVEGVWAAGEIADPVFRQVITSAGMGAAAAIQAQRWLDEHEDESSQTTALLVAQEGTFSLEH
jgi:thioredoxin reductase (NADPH)